MDSHRIDAAVRDAFAQQQRATNPAPARRLQRQPKQPRMISPHIDASDPIGSAARLSILAEDYRAAGQPVPAEIMDGMRLIRSQAEVRLTPQQQREALKHVHYQRAQLLQERTQERQRLAEREEQSNADTAARKLTAGLSDRAPEGLSAAQFSELQEKGSFTASTGAPDRKGFEKALGKVAASFNMKPSQFRKLCDECDESPGRLTRSSEAPGYAGGAVSRRARPP